MTLLKSIGYNGQEICTHAFGLTGKVLYSVFADSDNLFGAHYLGLLSLRFADAKLDPKSSDLESSYVLPYKLLYMRSYRPYVPLYRLCTCPRTVLIRVLIPSLYIALYHLYTCLHTIRLISLLAAI